MEPCLLCEEFNVQLWCAITALRNFQYVGDVDAVIAPMLALMQRYQRELREQGGGDFVNH